MKLNWILVLISFFHLSYSWADNFCNSQLLSSEQDNLVKTERFFESIFETNYRSGHCGHNIAQFIKKSLDEGHDLRGAMMLEIEGYGGLTGYAARGPGGPSQITWQSHHVVLLVPNKANPSQLLTDYKVIDFDFTNEPKVIAFKDYLDEMFIPPYHRGNMEKIRRNFDLGLIKFNGMDANQIYRYFEEPNPHRRHAIRLESVIFTEKKFKPTYFGEE